MPFHDVSLDARHRAAERNHARLAALAAGPPGLVVAAIAFDASDGGRASRANASAAAVIADLPGAVVWAWSRGDPSEKIAGDLATLRGALGDAARVVLVLRPRARVLSAPLAGEVGAAVEGVDAVPLLRAVSALDEGQLVRGVDVPWSDEAEARAAEAGFVTPAPRG
jgi:hypothetical protein